MGCRKNQHTNNCCSMNMKLLNSLHDFPQRFINFSPTTGSSFTCDDEEMSAWEIEAKRWAMVLFLVSEEDHCLEPVLKVCESLFYVFYFIIVSFCIVYQLVYVVIPY